MIIEVWLRFDSEMWEARLADDPETFRYSTAKPAITAALQHARMLYGPPAVGTTVEVKMTPADRERLAQAV